MIDAQTVYALERIGVYIVFKYCTCIQRVLNIIHVQVQVTGFGRHRRPSYETLHGGFVIQSNRSEGVIRTSPGSPQGLLPICKIQNVPNALQGNEIQIILTYSNISISHL